MPTGRRDFPVWEKGRDVCEEEWPVEADDFSHEQSLVLDTKEGLVIFNSCSHGGADVIIREAEAAFPGKQIYGLIGGFHFVPV